MVLNSIASAAKSSVREQRYPFDGDRLLQSLQPSSTALLLSIGFRALCYYFQVSKLGPTVEGIEHHPRELEMVTRNDKFSREIIVERRTP